MGQQHPDTGQEKGGDKDDNREKRKMFKLTDWHVRSNEKCVCERN